MSDVYVRLLLQSEQYQKKLKDAEKQLNKFKNKGRTMVITPKSIGTLAKGLAGLAGLSSVSQVLMDITKSSMALEKSLSSLGSLTGATADDLDFFKQRAIDMSTQTSQSATDIVEAFKLIGGQRAELLDSREALVSVTQSAITLSEAAETDVPTAAKALTGALNQMGAGAEAADSYINAMAAGAQEGAGEIDYLMKAVEKSGGTASATGVKFNELVAAIETLAPRITEAESAGTQLRNVLLKLESSADRELRPSVNGLGGALAALAEKHYDAAQMAKLFGTENVNAALALTENLDTYNDMVKAVTGTNTAYEMAEKNTDNLAGAVDRLSNSWDGLWLSVNNTNGALKSAVDWLAEVLNGARDLLIGIDQLKVNRIDEGTTGQIKESYGRIQKDIEGGKSRQEAFASEIERLKGELDSGKERLGRIREELTRSGTFYDDRAAGKALADFGSKYAWLAPPVGLGLKWLGEKSVESSQYGQQEEQIKSLEAAIKSLQKQASATVETPSGGTQQDGGGKQQDGGVQTTPGRQEREPYEAGSIGALQEELRGLRDRFSRETTATGRMTLQAQIVEVEGQINAAELSAKVSEEMSRERPLLGRSELTADVGAAMPAVPDLTETLRDAGLLEEELRGVGDALDEAFGPLTSGLIGGMMQGLNSLTGENAELWERVTASLISAAAQIGLMLALRGLEKEESGGKSPAGGLFSGIASGLFSGLFGGFFADGGIVGGHDYGDGVVARVSSGEMVINQADQRRLLGAIKQGTGGGTTRAYLEAETIVMSLNNYGRRTGKGTIKFG